jgi:hypothetical protein
MHPAVFIGTMVLMSQVFALQEWVGMHHMGHHVDLASLIGAWAFHFYLWGAICWTLGALLRPAIERAGIVQIVAGFLPLSIVLSVVEEMAFLLVFYRLPINHPNMPYLQRVTLYLADGEFIDNMVIFWCAFFLFRGIGYYQRSREHEQAAARLEIQLANAQLSALRMQLNPHFLFNTMNSISSLMRTDVEAADTMLEQLSCLMRITLERGDAQFICLRDEIDFIETYLGMQERRYAGRVRQSLSIDPELYDALVPCMLLQPVVENAFMHGLSKIDSGELSLKITRCGDLMDLSVLNSGLGLRFMNDPKPVGHGLGLMNIQSRLRLHYGEEASLSMVEVGASDVQVTIRLPLQFSPGGARLEAASLVS